MLNHDFIEKAFSDIDRNLTILRKHRSITVEQLERDTELLWMVSHGLQLTVQALIDIGTHMLSNVATDRWEKYTEIPLLLFEHKIISDKSSKSLIEMIKMRNVLAHEYLFIEASKVANVLNNHLEDIPAIVIEYQSYFQKPL
ncbi:MAG: DUF86 domain-containing protein [Bacteroidota bacterium]|nr:DUF86 domain-containing protein [Bacteroidota bacterium]